MPLTGVAAMKGKVLNFKQHFPDKVLRALNQEAEIELTEAKRRTPVDTGALRASGFVQAATRRWRSMVVTIGFGGAAETYAIYVHENLEAFHRIGQAKFLESTLKESAPYMLERLARRFQITIQDVA